jgi:putative ABC transport system permease protein
VAHQLKDGNRSTTAGRPQGRFRNVLVGFEVAMSVVLLASAGLLVHSFAQLYQIDPGMRLDHMVAMNVSLPATHYPDPAKRSATLAEVADRLRPLPGVKSVGLTSCTPLSGSCNILFFYIEGRPFVPGKFFSAFEQSVDPGFFAAAGIPLRQGRTFRRDDGVGFDPQHPRLGAVVISEAMARTFFPTESPIGKRIFFDYELQRERNQQIPTPRYEIVGVVGDVVPSLDAKIGPALYRPLLDVANNGASVVVHTAVDPQAVVSSVRNEIHQVDRGISIGRARTLDDLVSQSTSDRRFTMLLFAAFAALAVLLAAMGLYGVVSFAVSRRTAEIGVRMALGATTGDVGRLILLQGLKPAAIGIVCGLLAAAFATRLVKDLLFGVVPLDPLTFAVVPPALLGVAALACIVPAWRAMRLNPTTALRTE